MVRQELKLYLAYVHGFITRRELIIAIRLGVHP